MPLHRSTVENLSLLLLAKQGRALSRHLAGTPKDGDLELLSGLLPVVESLLDNAARQDNGRPAWRDAERYRKSMGIYAPLAGAQRGAVWNQALERERQGVQSEAYRRGLAIAAEANSESGAVSLPLAAAQAAIALGLASGVASLMAWAQGLIGGVL